ncbi:MAG: protein of unknown function YibQ [Firmicutes bacterium]|nr:protein of unknown function YibQ [Bacillota bacterium]
MAKKPSKPARPSRSSRPSRKLTVLLLLFIVTAGLYYYISHKPEQGSKPLPPSIEKTSSGTVADYSEMSIKLHNAVDNGLSTNGIPVGEKKELQKETPRQGGEGLIRWRTWQTQVTAPQDKTPEKLRQLLQSSVARAGGEILAMQPDHYQGRSVTRMDIGFKEILAGDTLTIITDRLYIGSEKPSSPIQVPPQTPALPVRPSGPGVSMAIIIDDFGYQTEPIEMFAAIDRPITFSVLPYKQYSRMAAERGAGSGHQVLLHLPMEPMTLPDQVEKDMITVQMTEAQIQDIVLRALQHTPEAIGVNNHQGSRATADRRVMQAALSVMRNNQLFFIDSRTSGQTVGMDMARQMVMRTGENDLFLDNSSDIGYIKNQLRTAQRMAAKNGSVTVIGHARTNTAMAIREMIPELEANGVRLVFVSQLVR